MEQRKFTPDEIEKIKAVGIESFEGRCACGIHPDKPSFCKAGPFPDSLVPGCSYYFLPDAEGNLQRHGDCNDCGACCALPRKDGSPYGVYSPLGRACVHLLVDGKPIDGNAS